MKDNEIAISREITGTDDFSQISEECSSDSDLGDSSQENDAPKIDVCCFDDDMKSIDKSYEFSNTNEKSNPTSKS